MQFGQKTLKAFSFDLLHDLEVSLLDILESGVEKDWTKWLSLANKGIIEKATKNATKNKRTTNFTTFASFKQNLDFADPVELIASYAAKGNEYFKRFFKNDKERNLLIQAIGEANRFRNLIFHQIGRAHV